MTGAALDADDLTLGDVLADRDRPGRLHVGVPGAHVPGVGDDHDPGRVRTVRPVPADVDHGPGGCRPHRGVGRPDQVDAVVIVGAAVAGRVVLERAAAVVAADR